MHIVIDTGNTVYTNKTPKGGRVTELHQFGKIFRCYIHPSRANSNRRLEFDIQKLRKASAGESVKGVTVVG